MKYVIFAGFLATAGIFSAAEDTDTSDVGTVTPHNSQEEMKEIPVEFIEFTTPLIISTNK